MVGRLPARELVEWSVFAEEFGPLTVQERIDHMAAQIVWAIGGRKGRVSDFLPRWQPARAWSEDNVIDWLTALAKRKDA